MCVGLICVRKQMVHLIVLWIGKPRKAAILVESKYSNCFLTFSGLIPQNKTITISAHFRGSEPRALSRGQGCFFFVYCLQLISAKGSKWNYSINMDPVFLPSEDSCILCCSTALKGNSDQKIRRGTQFHCLKLWNVFPLKPLPPSQAFPLDTF